MLKLGKLYPFGYAGKGAQARLEALMADENMHILDIRLKPQSRWSAYWNRASLSATWLSRYHWVGFSLGNKNYNNDLPIELVDERGISSITELLRQGQHAVVVCACRDYDRCHRKTVVELVKQQLPDVEVIL